MTQHARTQPTRRLHQFARAALGSLPARHMLRAVSVDDRLQPRARPKPHFRHRRLGRRVGGLLSLLHDAYVQRVHGPDPSGLRVTPYHALPTTTTLFACFDGEIIGTLSIIREGVFGLPLQSVFDLTAVRAQGGRIAEISASGDSPSVSQDRRHDPVPADEVHVRVLHALLRYPRIL